ncbi:hypothetical protein WA1_18680 [Scytonema hofmannii PCC 7110]|uniref:Uncharacterized protein n=1 Tax=Scytonema hofmannii PCC 7110 TaxID=128403 RepID=A0A139XBF1_9CYAN|nr:hypothetical protein [Scytonema hofmannii]KYC42030.1 hypothetical protein WA1_18680 [Scytonema hofmannii PCC 7110]
MIDIEIRQELRRIITEFKKPLPANQHKVRDLPGTSNRWIYLPHQAIRERLDEVAPDWTIDYSELQYVDNNCVCRCGITILSVRKEAIACVPISLLSSNNKEMTRGSAADRVAAESVRNAGEQWGIGRYLDDQVFVYKYLWENRHQLDDEMQGELQKLKLQHSKALSAPQPRAKEEGSVLHSMTNTSPVLTITDGQRKRLWAVGKNEYKLSDAQIKSAYKHFGFDKPEAIAASKYDDVMSYMKALSQQTQSPNNTAIANPNAQPTSPQDLYPHHKAIIEAIRQKTGHKGNWIVAQCQAYGCDRTGMMPPEKLERLICDMCADFAVSIGTASDRQGALTAIGSAIAFAKGSGQPVLDAALAWLERYSVPPSVKR